MTHNEYKSLILPDAVEPARLHVTVASSYAPRLIRIARFVINETVVSIWRLLAGLYMPFHLVIRRKEIHAECLRDFGL